jgi:hypothetical protein
MRNRNKIKSPIILVMSRNHHLELNGEGPDMQAVLEMLGRLSPEAQEAPQTKVQEMMREVVDASTREGLVRHFLKARDETPIVAEIRSGNSTDVFATTNSTNVKPPIVFAIYVGK